MLRQTELKVWNDTLKMMLDISDVEEYYNLKNQKRSVYHDHSKDKLIFYVILGLKINMVEVFMMVIY